MNELYWTECDRELIKYLRSEGFSIPNVSYVHEYGSCRLDFSEKRVLGLDFCKSFYKTWEDYKYISNAILKKMIEESLDKTNVDEFKVGDTVICIWGIENHTDWNYGLKQGNKYTVSAVSEDLISIKELAHTGWKKSRFKIINEKEINMNNKKIAIKVGNNQELSRIVQEFLFTKGYGWGFQREKIYKNRHQSYKDIVFLLSEDKIDWEANGETHGCNTYCAATQFGEIITLLSEPPKPVIKIKNDVGQEYEADFAKNPGCVTFGCATIANEVFKTLKNVLFDIKIDLRNGKIVEQIKIGRGLFSPTDIKAIVEHPDFGKGNE